MKFLALFSLPLLAASHVSLAAPLSACGKLLKSDPHYEHFEGQILDSETIQDLLTLRFERFRKPVLLVGEREDGKSLVANAIFEKIKALDIPYVKIGRRAMDSNIPELQAPANLDYYYEDGFRPVDIRDRLPSRPFVLVEYEQSDIYPPTGCVGPSGENPMDLKAVENSLKIIELATAFRNGLAIHTMSAKAFEDLSARKRGLYANYTVLRVFAEPQAPGSDRPRLRAL